MKGGHGLRFRILGPLWIDAGDCVVSVTSPKQRAILAVLLLHANRCVPTAELIDQVWGERCPASVRSIVHTYIWRLRQTFDEHELANGHPRIAHQPGGYQVRVAEGELDAQVFEQLVREGLTSLGAADLPRARAHLRDALALWSGEPLGDLDIAGPAAAECSRLSELYRQALNARIEADLMLGQHAEVTAELRALIAANPLDEQLHAHMMTALSQSGRRADALQAYAEARQLLAGELGLEPGLQLRRLQAAILRGDSPVPPNTVQIAEGHPEVASMCGCCEDFRRHSEDAQGMERALTLGQILADREAGTFQGRQAEMARIWDLLEGRDQLPRMVQIHGAPGIGKSAFVYALKRLCDRRGYPAVILDSRDFRHEAGALSDILAERRARAEASGNNRPLLLVFDTFEEMRDMECGFWDVFLPSLEGQVLVVLCGRQSPPGPPGSRRWRGLVDELEIRALSDCESRRLLHHHGVCDGATADSIIGFAHGNPLFLTVAAQHARPGRPWDTALSNAVAVSLIGRMTRETADPDVRRLIEAASLVRTFNQELLEEMTGGDASGSFSALYQLSVVRVVPAGARLHDLVRESVAADLCWRAPVASQVMRRRAHVYLARMAASSSEPGPYVQELLHLAAESSLPQVALYSTGPCGRAPTIASEIAQVLQADSNQRRIDNEVISAK